MFYFVRNGQAVFQNGYIILYSHQQWMRVPVVPYPHQHLVLSVFWILAILLGMHLTILICISLMPYEVKHLFICLFSICIFSLERCLLRSLVPLFSHIIFFLLNLKSSLYLLDNSPYKMSFGNIFSQSVSCILILLMLSFPE